MIDHREAILALFVIAALIVGTAGYETIQADRSADVSVANDADAYLALEPTGNTIQNGSTGSVLVITNQFGSEVDIEVRIVRTSDNVSSSGISRTVQPGISTEVEATCATKESGHITIDISARGNGVQFQTTREISVECT